MKGNKCITLMQKILIIGKTWSKGEGKWELPYAQFFCKSKTAQKT